MEENLRNNQSILSDSDIITESRAEISRLSLNLSQMSLDEVYDGFRNKGVEAGHAVEDGHAACGGPP